MELQERLDALTAVLATNGQIPDPIVKGFFDGIREMVASGLADSALKAGDVAPEFTLPDAVGVQFSSAAMLARGPLIISFYRGVWCPYCNLELQALEEARVGVEAQGGSMVAVSMQTAANSRKSVRENDLHFPILIDKGGVVAAQFGVRYRLTAKMIELNKAVGNDLEKINGEDSWSLPIPGRFVIAQDGIIAFAEVNADYTQRPDPSHLLCILRKLASAELCEETPVSRSVPVQQPTEKRRS